MSSSRRISPALARVLACAFVGALVPAATALAGPTVSVRVEGESSTLLPATTVTLGSTEPLKGCPAGSAAAAINIATGGNWDQKAFTETILGETHSFTHFDTWAEWVNYKWGGGICNDILHEGDEVLMVADLEPPPAYAASVLPLVITEAPTVAQAGSPFSVKVSVVRLPAGEVPPGSGTLEPAVGVTVSAGEVHSPPTGPSGVATLTLASVGTATLRATRTGYAPSRTFAVCVHNGLDGTCGTTPPNSPSNTQTSGSGGVSGFSSSSPYTGPYAVVAKATGLIDGHVYSRRHAPRVLTGSVLAHTTVRSVSIRLRRSYRGRCHAYDGIRERFLSARCGHGSFFKVSTERSFSYLLPSALPAGRYVLDIEATDAVGNHTRLARGTSRIVFYVR
jgi:hypothetical protein